MNWLKSRVEEGSTIDGLAMVAACGAVILFGDSSTTIRNGGCSVWSTNYL